MNSENFFCQKRVVRMSETDATGSLYFTNFLKFAVEAFEEFLEGVNSKDYLLPGVSAKSSYIAPLYRNDEILLKLSVTKIGNSSFELSTRIEKRGVQVGFVEIIHVVTSEATKQKISIPNLLKELLVSIKNDIT